MASLYKRNGGSYFINVYVCGKSLTIYPGTSDRREAERFLDHVQSLEDAARAGRPVAYVTAAWVEQLLASPATIRQYDSLARAGLVVERAEIERAQKEAADAEQAARDAESAKNWPLVQLIDRFIATLAHVKPQTLEVYRQSRGSLLEHFGEGRQIESITAADAATWKKWMLSKFAKATVSKRVKHARAYFRFAVDSGLIERNPFEKVKAGSDASPERKHYVSHAIVRTVIDAATDAEWKLIIGLAYYAGLRCPSEVYALRWDGIDRAGRRFTVATPKTTGHGRSQKTLPLFPEIEALLAAVERTGDPHVVTRHRLAAGNLASQVSRFIKRAGVKPWPKMFNNLRASRRTDLARTGKFTDHALTEWFGHDPETANKHYMMTVDDDYALASETWADAQGLAQGLGDKLTQTEDKPFGGLDAKSARVLRAILAKHGLILGSTEVDLMTPTGFEPVSRQ